MQVSSGGGGGGTTSSSDSHGGKVKCHLRNVSGGLHHREVKKITDSGESSPKSVLVAVFFGGGGWGFMQGYFDDS